ncbi:hypothetical protein [Nostoc sp.]|uniref:hypothetical protein n=1 Tax=Nostoc sp. TaxID=1180 RepID=UPI002FF9D9F2
MLGKRDWGLGIGDWGLGIRDWGLGIVGWDFTRKNYVRDFDSNGTKLRHSSWSDWFPAWRLGTDFGRLRLQWIDQRQQPSGNTFPGFRLGTRRHKPFGFS